MFNVRSVSPAVASAFHSLGGTIVSGPNVAICGPGPATSVGGAGGWPQGADGCYQRPVSNPNSTKISNHLLMKDDTGLRVWKSNIDYLAHRIKTVKRVINLQ